MTCAAPRDVEALRGASLAIYFLFSLLYAPCVFLFFVFSSVSSAAWGGGGIRCQTFSFCYPFSSVQETARGTGHRVK